MTSEEAEYRGKIIQILAKMTTQDLLESLSTFTLENADQKLAHDIIKELIISTDEKQSKIALQNWQLAETQLQLYKEKADIYERNYGKQMNQKDYTRLLEVKKLLGERE